MDRISIAVFLRHIAPWRASAQPAKDAVNSITVVLGRSSSPALTGFSLTGNKTLKNTALDLCQIAAAQGCLLESAALNQFAILASLDFVHAAQALRGGLK